MIRTAMQKSWQLFTHKISKVLLLLIVVTAACISGAAFHQDPIQKSHWTIGLEGVAYATTPDVTVDGDNDDADVQSVLNSLPSSGGSITLFAGVWDFDATVTRAVDNITIYGTGSGTQIITDGAFEPFDCTGQDYWKFADFSCDQAPTYDSAGGYPVSTIIDGLWIAGTFTIEYPAGTLSTSTGSRSVTLIVAGVDAAADVQAGADYVCDGTADEVQWNAAIAALPAGRTSEATIKGIGTFTPAASIVLVSYTNLDLTEAVFNWTASDILFEAIGTEGTGVDLANSEAAESELLEVAATGTFSTTLWAAGNYILISDDHIAFTSKKGEIHQVTAIVANTSVTIDVPLWQSFDTVTYDAEITPLTMVHHFSIVGGHVVGAGSTAATGNSGLRFTYCAEFEISGMKIENCCFNSMGFQSCVAGNIHDNYIYGSARSGYGYGIGVWWATNTMDIHNNNIRHCIHGVACDESTSSVYGAPMMITIRDNVVVGDSATPQDKAQLDCHEGRSQGIRFLGNTVIAYQAIGATAISWEASNNIFDTTSVCVALRADDNMTENIVLRNNHVRHCGLNVIKLGNGAAEGSALKNVEIDGLFLAEEIDAQVVYIDTTANCTISINNVQAPYGNTDASVGLHIDTGGGSIKITNNVICDMQWSGIRILNAYYGIVANNVCLGNEQTNGASADAGISLENCLYITITGNNCTSTDAVHQDYGIKEIGTADYNLIVGNTCLNNATDGILGIGLNTVEASNME